MALIIDAFNDKAALPEIDSPAFIEKIEKALGGNAACGEGTQHVIEASGGLEKALKAGTVVSRPVSVSVAVETDMRPEQKRLDALADSLRKTHGNLIGLHARSSTSVDVTISHYEAVKQAPKVVFSA